MLSKEDKEDWYRFVNGGFKLYLRPDNLPFDLNSSKLLKFDLHGYSVNNAYIFLKETIPVVHNKKVKEILIITGASGIIKKEFNDWVKLEIFKKYIKKIEQKNSGSFLVFLNN